MTGVPEDQAPDQRASSHARADWSGPGLKPEAPAKGTASPSLALQASIPAPGAEDSAPATQPLDRRDFFSWVKHGLGGAALTSLLLREGRVQAAAVPGESVPRCPHFAPRAR